MARDEAPVLRWMRRSSTGRSRMQRLHVGCVALLDGADPVRRLRRRRWRSAWAASHATASARCARSSTSTGRAGSVTRRSRSAATCATSPCRRRAASAELHALVDELFATRLDPRRPLWETYLDRRPRGRAQRRPLQGPSRDDRRRERRAGAGGAQRSGRGPGSGCRDAAGHAHARGQRGAALERPGGDRAASTLARWLLEPSASLPLDTAITAERRCAGHASVPSRSSSPCAAPRAAR